MKIKLQKEQILFISILKLILIGAFILGYCFNDLKGGHKQTTQILPSSSITFDENSDLPDFSTYTDTKQKKSDFFSYLLPRAIKSNNAILIERSFLLNLNIKNELSNSDSKQLFKLAEKYKVSDKGIKQQYEQLLEKVDVIPPSLVLAQAANESAWGTSRFAKKANNLFGQWCYVKGCGIIPLKRGSSERHEVAKYSSIQGSITSYMKNLNTQISYADLRTLRKEMRNDGETVSGYELANGLLKYSTRREAYVHEIQSMIKHNGLSQYDK